MESKQSQVAPISNFAPFPPPPAENQKGMNSTPPPQKPATRLPAASRLGRRIRDFDLLGMLQGPKLTPEFLASDVAGFVLHVVLARDWPSFWRAKLCDAVPVSRTISEALIDFRSSLHDERWHTENLTEERKKKWNPHIYHSPPPRLRTYREILNRYQALRNCCGAQLRELDTPEVVRNLLLQIAMALYWVSALVKHHMAVIWLVAEIENKTLGYRQAIEGSVPPVVRKGDGIMPVARDGQKQCCLKRIQQRINRGQSLISRFRELELCQVEKEESPWDETEWLEEKDGEIPADMPDEDRFLVNRVLFSVGLSWFMVSISCDFATFYLLILAMRLRRCLFGR